MCGPSAGQQELQAEQTDFYKTAIAESAAVFGQQQELHQQIESIFSPILQRGPNQMGFSQQELDVLNASAVEGTAQTYQQASRALTAKLAAQGGGNIAGMTGSQEQLEEELAQGSAQEQAQQQTQIQESGYQQGYQEFSDATKAISGVADQLSPTSYMGQATGAGSAAAKTAADIAQEQNSWVNAVIGAAGQAAGQMGGAAMACWIAAELYGGWHEPRTEIVRRWMVAHPRVLAIYIQVGPFVASLIRKHRMVRRLIKPLFDLIVEQEG